MANSSEIRDQRNDHLLTPENAALVVIDYQPTQVQSVQSGKHQDFVKNMVALARLAKLYKLPVILSTVNVESGKGKDTMPVIKDALGDVKSYDRTTINAWEDKDFVAAVKATGRKKLIMTALWTEACLTFPTLDALKEGYEVYPVVDAVGGTSPIAHETALRRMEQAGAQLTSTVQVACELQRDWNREDTAKEFTDILTEVGAFSQY